MNLRRSGREVLGTRGALGAVRGCNHRVAGSVPTLMVWFRRLVTSEDLRSMVNAAPGRCVAPGGSLFSGAANAGPRFPLVSRRYIAAPDGHFLSLHHLQVPRFVLCKCAHRDIRVAALWRSVLDFRGHLRRACVRLGEIDQLGYARGGCRATARPA